MINKRKAFFLRLYILTLL
ncbi:hypothetical protein GMOD_00010392 [Pyrenophora seminiperda CCB06]|uniref:Uncharacterized protein n=1 Tax=Pyrenophora seminiperda CCB06 TaxID=1302712 RepID=A0A3M7M5C1_9PLEO|nr:hypothetical protein GMOD_00010392 [Pyrenophora seminiperda CCB06]